MPTLDWLNREAAFDTAARVPYRLLEAVSVHGDVAADNLLIQGDNLEALKSLLPLYRGQVKCNFIDPPYSTKSAFEHCDDNLEHAQWLSMMLPRLQLLREFLRPDGNIWVTIDDNEGALPEGVDGCGVWAHRQRDRACRRSTLGRGNEGGAAVSTVVPPPRRYFVDEAGDPTLFGSRGKVMLGSAGCSRNFMLGVVDVANPLALGTALESLRQSLLADPYFRGVPSMQPERRKTALAFHANDDVAEVRREVFRELMRHDLKFFAVVRDKQRGLAYVQQRNHMDAAYRYRPNELYDSLVARLFKDRLHLSLEVEVCFASRGSSDRSAALTLALHRARQRFEAKWDTPVAAQLSVRESTPARAPALQAADYFLWALQRHFERGESRFLELVWPNVGLVHAVDETASAPYGMYYTKKRPLV